MAEERLHEWNETEHPKKRAFLVAFAECGSITAACNAAEVGRTTVWRWRREDEVFHALCDRAEQIAGDELEEIARQRAKAGSDTLLIFLLKGLKPDKYGDSLRLRKQFESMSDEDLDAIIASGKSLASSDTPS
jgi:hypothetical protein